MTRPAHALRMRWVPVTLLACLALVVLCPLPAYADERAQARPAYTQMEAGPYGRAHFVAVVEVMRVVEIAPRPDAQRGPQLIHGKVTRIIKAPPVLRGRATVRGSDVTIRIGGPRPTLNPGSPSTPYIPAHARGTYVFFGTRRSGGHAFDMDAMFKADSAEGQQKIEALSRIADLQKQRNNDRRAKATLQWLVETQRSTSRWSRVNGARELNYLVEMRPDLFDVAVRQSLRSVPGARMPRDQRVWLRRVFTILGDRTGGGFDPTASDESAWAEAYRKAADEPTRKALLTKAMHDARTQAGPDAYADVLTVWDESRRGAVRLEIMTLAIDGSHTAWLPFVRSRYAEIESVPVREAIIRAMGFLGTDTDVSWLQARMGNRGLARAAQLALARIRTSAALEVLRREHARCAAGSAEDRARGRWLAHLLSSNFVDEELAAGHAIGPRTPSDR